MERKEGMDFGVTVKEHEAPESYRVEPKGENHSLFSGSTTVAAPPVSVAAPGMQVKKKRGRPRKYDRDGTPMVALSPMPISASIPMTGEFSAWKRGGGRPADSFKKQNKFEFGSSGETVAYSVGANFTPHVMTVNAGEDVSMKILSFSQQGSRAICILSANGTISNVTLRHPNSFGDTLTYEGRFEILSLSGSFMPTETAGTKSRSGGMSVSLAGPDGRVVGGGLAGLLVAAGPVQVVVGSFLSGHQQEQKPKKPRFQQQPISVPSPTITSDIFGGDTQRGYSSLKPIPAPSPFNGDNPGSLNSMHSVGTSATENKASTPGEESKGPSQSNCGVSH